MSASPFQEALEGALAPLRIAAGNPVAAARVRDFERTVRAAAEWAAALRIPREARALLVEVSETFAAALDAESRAKAAGRALERLASLADPDFGARALARPPSALPGIGPKRAAALERKGIATVAALLFRLPVRYDDRRHLLRIADLEVGARATFVAQVRTAGFAPGRVGKSGFRRVLHALVSDETGSIELKWFRGGEAVEPMLKKGVSLLVTGDVTRWRFSKELIHPEIEPLDDAAQGGTRPVAALRSIVPEYADVEGVPPRTLRRWVQGALAELGDLVEGWLPARLVAERQLPSVAAALAEIHAPSPDADLAALAARRSPAHERLVLEELFLLELGLALRRQRRERERGVAIAASQRVERAAAGLPFALTGAQRRVLAEIAADLAAPHPMNRLLQGDVGSGKTAVAFLAAVAAADAGFQSALMAPTELLAEQHERSLRRLADSGGAATALRIALLTASVPKREAKEIRAALAGGEIDLVVGTHALVQDEVQFASLGLAVIDEQHRFGVLQRQALAGKRADGRAPHVLVMTATPIPRTLALTLSGELDVSVLDELPPGRTPITTDLLREGEGARVVELVRQTLARGEQVYVVYPLVEESEATDLRAATERAARIARAFPQARVDLVHGRLDAKERNEAMRRFERGESQILVSTTVIEVGVDVPKATLMVIEHAERFGLAQLHQLRGRIGRGTKPGTCVLVARGSTPESEARLAALMETRDGFAIAEADLAIRGPGEFLGTRQSGRLPDLHLADLLRDAHLIPVARQAALETVRRDPALAREPGLRRAVSLRWGARLALADVG